MNNKKIIINDCIGGFGLSDRAIKEYAERKGIKIYTKKDPIIDLIVPVYTPEGKNEQQVFEPDDIPRDDKDLVAVVEKLGSRANGEAANLKVASIESSLAWEIEVDEGKETVKTFSPRNEQKPEKDFSP